MSLASLTLTSLFLLQPYSSDNLVEPDLSIFEPNITIIEQELPNDFDSEYLAQSFDVIRVLGRQGFSVSQPLKLNADTIVVSGIKQANGTLDSLTPSNIDYILRSKFKDTDYLLIEISRNSQIEYADIKAHSFQKMLQDAIIFERFFTD